MKINIASLAAAVLFLSFLNKSFGDFVSSEKAYPGEPGGQEWVLDNLDKAIPFSKDQPYKIIRNGDVYGGAHSLKSYRLKVGEERYFIKISALKSGRISTPEKSVRQKEIHQLLNLDRTLEEAGIQIVYPVHDNAIVSYADELEMTVYPLVQGIHMSWAIDDYVGGRADVSEFNDFLMNYYQFLGKTMALVYKNSGGFNEVFKYNVSFWLDDRNMRNQLYDASTGKFYLLDTVDFEEKDFVDKGLYVVERSLWHLLKQQIKNLHEEDKVVKDYKSGADRIEVNTGEPLLELRDLDVSRITQEIYRHFHKGFFSVFHEGECQPVTREEYRYLIHSLKRGDKRYPIYNSRLMFNHCS